MGKTRKPHRIFNGRKYMPHINSMLESSSAFIQKTTVSQLLNKFTN